MLDATDFDACYAAVRSRDRRFDGRFVTGVLTTGIYCRPSCPARTPNRENVRFFPSPAAAQGQGLRACRRCRPELAPDAPGADPQADVAARALRLIEAGLADEGVEALAAAVHLSPRQLQRVLVDRYGAGPAALARMRRVRLARLLVDQTDLPLTRVALAAGFGSVRQFNDAFRQAFAVTPSSVRASARQGAPLPDGGHEVALSLPVRSPFDGEGVLRWAAVHAIPSRDQLDLAPADGGPATWVRTTADQVVRMTPSATAVEVRVRSRAAAGAAPAAEVAPDVGAAVTLARQAFDLDADVQAVSGALGDDPVLAPLVRDRPGVRIPGSPDPFEGAVRVVLGQQVSAGGATTLMGRLADLHDGPGLPPPGEVADMGLEELVGLPRMRATAVRALARAVAGGLDLSPGADPAATVAALQALPGIGAWTAQAIALLVLRQPDAWPTGDLALRRSAGVLTGTTPSARELDRMAERWRPWRGYAALWLWHAALDR